MEMQSVHKPVMNPVFPDGSPIGLSKHVKEKHFYGKQKQIRMMYYHPHTDMHTNSYIHPHVNQHFALYNVVSHIWHTCKMIYRITQL